MKKKLEPNYELMKQSALEKLRYAHREFAKAMIGYYSTLFIDDDGNFIEYGFYVDKINKTHKNLEAALQQFSAIHMICGFIR